MARLMWLADVARTTGYPVVEESGWETRGDNEMVSRPLGGLYHHTAGPKNSDTSLNYPSLNTVKFGRPDLDGPLAHYGVGFDGTIHVIASGKANHAGEGGWPGISGNADLIGVEVEHPGVATEPWPWQQRESVRGLFAAVAHHLDYASVGTVTGSSYVLLGHKEWAPGRKIDPIATDMDEERSITHSYKGNPDVPISQQTIDAISATITPDVTAAVIDALTTPRISSAVGDAVHRHRGIYDDTAGDPVNFQLTVRRILNRVDEIRDDVDGVVKDVAKLVAAIPPPPES